MESNLHFVFHLNDGSQVEQDVPCPAEKSESVMQQLLLQFSQVGVLKRVEETGKYTLIMASQIGRIECELPSLVIATPSDTARIAQAAGGLKKIHSV